MTPHFIDIFPEQKKGSLTLSPIVIGFFGAIYAAIFVSIPWEYLRGDAFPDKLNYITNFDYILNSGFDALTLTSGVLGALISEVAWSAILLSLGSIGLNGEQALGVVSFFCIYTLSTFLFKRTSILVGSVFLLNPLLIDFVMAQQRSALAFSLFLLMTQANGRFLKLIFAVAASFVHLAFLLLLAVYFTSKLLENRRFINVSLLDGLMRLGLAFSIAILVLVSKELVLGALGDRRADAHNGSQSAMYTFFWLILVIYVGVFSQKLSTEWWQFFGVLFVAFSVTAVALNSYSSRYLVFAYPFLIVSLCGLRSFEAIIGLFFLFVYQYIQWIYWWGWFTR